MPNLFFLLKGGNRFGCHSKTLWIELSKVIFYYLYINRPRKLALDDDYYCYVIFMVSIN